MSSDHHHSTAHGTPEPAARNAAWRWKWVFGGFAILALLLLAFEHRMHLSGLRGWLPYLILLACPLMHLFMHGGHGGHDDKSEGDQK